MLEASPAQEKARIVEAPAGQGEITIRGCTLLNNGGYGVFADGQYDDTGRVTVANCLFYGAVAPTPFHIRLQSLTGSIPSVEIRDNCFRGTPGAVQVVNSATLRMQNNMADTNTINIGFVTTLLHSGNSWDSTVLNLTTGLAALASWQGSTTLAGSSIGDTVAVGYDGFPNGLLTGGSVSAAGTVQLTLFNSGVEFGPTTGNIRVSVSKHV
jgi:hypothetical protein